MGNALTHRGPTFHEPWESRGDKGRGVFKFGRHVGNCMSQVLLNGSKHRPTTKQYYGYE